MSVKQEKVPTKISKEWQHSYLVIVVKTQLNVILFADVTNLDVGQHIQS